MTAANTYTYSWERNGTAISGATSSTYKVQSADLGSALTCTVTAANATGSTPATSVATSVVLVAVGGLPAEPTGPTRPAAGYRVLLADAFAGTALDPKIWTATAHYPGAATISPGYNAYEAQAYSTANVTVAGGNCVLAARKETATPAGGATKGVTSGIISTSNAGNPFMFSPQHGGPFFIEARIKIPGDTNGSSLSTFPAFWASSCRVWGAPANSGIWTREMDFFEFHASTALDSVNIFPAGGYSTGGANMTNGGAYYTATTDDLANDFHTYTVQVNTNGSFQLWIDGHSQWTLPPAVAIDWMALIFDYALTRSPVAGWPGDQMVIDYVMVWNDAAVPAGTGVLGGGIAAGTTVSDPGSGPPPVAPIPYDTLIASLAPTLWLPLHETSGTVAADSSGKGYNGTYPASGVTYSGVNPNASPDVDDAGVMLGPSATISVANHSAFTNLSCSSASRWSLLMWVLVPSSNTGSGTGYPRLLQMGDGGSATGWQVFYSDTYHTVGFKGGAAHQSSASIANAVGPPGTSTLTTIGLLGLTWDGATVHFYMNGTAVGANSGAAGAAVTDTTSAMTIGPNIGCAELVVTSTALTAAQHTQVYTAFLAD